MAGKGKQKTSPGQLKAEERQVQALRLRLAGVGFPQIAEELKYANRSCAYAAVMAALEKARGEPAEELRELMLARLDEMLAGVWGAAISGDPDSVSAALRIEERRAKLLGLDKAPPLMSMAVAKVSMGDIDFSMMTNDELREQIRRETEKHADGDGGNDAAGTGTA
jgi:hypothetical protein